MTRDQLIQHKELLESQGKKLSPNSLVIRKYKESLKGLTPMQYEAAIGLVLGDARIERSKSNNVGHLLKFEWGALNKAYAFHVFELFKEYCITQPREQVRVNSKGVSVTTWCFQTLLHPDFDCIGQLFLNNGKKIVPQGLIQNHLTPVGLAYWFMDDGGMNGSHSHGIQFHTQSFSVTEVDIMVEELANKFEFKCWRGSNKGKPVINISASNFTHFKSLTDDYIIGEMKHKLRLR
jgi:hypothetical protein